MELVGIILPLGFNGGIAIFIVKRLEHKHKQGKLGKKKSKAAQNLLDSLIPLGMLFGCTVGLLLSMFFSISLLSTLSFSSGIGLLIGYFAYEIYGNKKNSYL
ncbi:hypothetical protein LZ480_11985 [Solibacillus sp. MA9]|uniref:Group-specific protein n=1 Tax=Solibacillus palustris TaxID=2908203 RepID=A0ABS9UE66_9BACL|nr:hypothetical protein [Solibacillus sp. MA9]MCH7322611.1 hypothetical protein [Solibacillus sp. MA9]